MAAGGRKRIVLAATVAAVLLLGWSVWRFVVPHPAPQVSPVAERAAPARAPLTPREMGPGTALLRWDEAGPQQVTSSGSLDRIAGYRIYVGPQPDALRLEAQLANPRATQYVVRQLPRGTSWFTVTTYTRLGMESDPPPPVSKQVE